MCKHLNFYRVISTAFVEELNNSLTTYTNPTICSALESIFQTPIVVLYRAFHDIFNRKKEQINYANRLEEDLERKILELEGL